MTAASPTGPGSADRVAAWPDPAMCRHELGRDLRQLREAHALRLEDVAVRLEVATSTISRIETGKAPARTRFVLMMLDMYQVTDPDRRRRLGDLARVGQRKGWWTEHRDLLPAGTAHYLGLEQAASLACAWATQVVPELLQTEAYTAAACRAARPQLSPAGVRDLVTVSKRRQAVLCRAGFRLHAVLDESVLRRTVGSAQLMAEQLDHLRAVAELGAVTLQVAPLDPVARVLSLPFTMLGFADPAASRVACYADPGGRVTVTAHGAEVRGLRAAFDTLATSALTPVESAELIRELAQRP
jgi:transcriptional regulator with XRE-family HTH domain